MKEIDVVEIEMSKDTIEFISLILNEFANTLKTNELSLKEKIYNIDYKIKNSFYVNENEINLIKGILNAMAYRFEDDIIIENEKGNKGIVNLLNKILNTIYEIKEKLGEK